MKRIILTRLLPVFLGMLFLLPSVGRTEEAPFEAVPCSKDGVDVFMEAFAAVCPGGILNGMPADEAHCWNVTPDSVAAQTDIRIFKFSNSCESYALADGQACHLCDGLGGSGFLNAVPWDYDGDGRTDLITASSWGSGIHRTEISVFIRATGTAKVLYSTMLEPVDPGDLAVVLETPAPDATPEIGLRLVDIRNPDPADFAHLRYRVTGTWLPLPFLVTRLPRWNGEAAAPLLGAWYLERSTEILAVIFSEDGTMTLRTIDAEAGTYEEYSARYWIDGQNLIYEALRETGVWPFALEGDTLSLYLFGPEPMVFTRLSATDSDWWAKLRPRYRPGDTSRAEIDYGASEHFTREEMDAAIGMIRETFAGWYGCEMDRLAYTSDEESAREFEYYAGPERRKTGRNYVDGIVFASSFRTPPEEEGSPASGLNPDDTYTGWRWILLKTDAGAWELVTWGY